MGFHYVNDSDSESLYLVGGETEVEVNDYVYL